MTAPSSSPDTIDLLPCPFCGGPATLHNLEGGITQIECANDDACSVCVDVRVRDTSGAAIKAWNTRAGDAQTLPSRAELANILDRIAKEKSQVYLSSICTHAMADAVLSALASTDGGKAKP